MKIKSITINRLLIVLIILFTNFSNVFAQEPIPDKSTKSALNALMNGPKVEPKKEFEYNDRSAIHKNIKSAFLNWSKKDEFEKQADYKARIQEQSQIKFTEICDEEIRERINSYNSSDLNIELSIYDAENEFFPTIFEFKGEKWKNQVKISIDKAQNFKEKEWRKLRWQIDESQWCYIYNELFPSKIYLESNSFDINFILPLLYQKEISVAFNDLELENIYLKDYIFKYSKTSEKEGKDKIYSPNGVPSARIDYGTGRSLDGNGNYQLGGRKAIDKKIIVQKCNESGVVVVSIEVDRNGKVISASPGVRGTTNNSKCLLEPARRMAIETKFNSDPKAPSNQIGKIIYRFSLSE